MSEYFNKLKNYKAIPLLIGVMIAFIGFLIFVFVKNNEQVLMFGLVLIVIGIIIGIYGLIKFSKDVSKHIKYKS